MQLARHLAERLAEFDEQATTLWQAYQARGPGRVDRELFDRVDQTSRLVTELLANDQAVESVRGLINSAPENWWQALRDSVAQVHDLSYRCACTPQGLCFIKR